MNALNLTADEVESLRNGLRRAIAMSDLLQAVFQDMDDESAEDLPSLAMSGAAMVAEEIATEVRSLDDLLVDRMARKQGDVEKNGGV